MSAEFDLTTFIMDHCQRMEQAVGRIEATIAPMMEESKSHDVQLGKLHTKVAVLQATTSRKSSGFGALAGVIGGFVGGFLQGYVPGGKP